MKRMMMIGALAALMMAAGSIESMAQGHYYDRRDYNRRERKEMRRMERERMKHDRMMADRGTWRMRRAPRPCGPGMPPPPPPRREVVIVAEPAPVPPPPPPPPAPRPRNRVAEKVAATVTLAAIIGAVASAAAQ